MKSGRSLHFYRNEHTKHELDFLVQEGGGVVPVEVKGGNNPSASLKAAMRSNPDIGLAYKVADANVGVSKRRHHHPALHGDVHLSVANAD